jgi:hypothetical protein
VFRKQVPSCDNVIVEKKTITSFSDFSAAIKRRALALIRLLDNPEQIWSFQLCEHFTCSIRRSVDHNDDFHIPERLTLLEKCFQAGTQSLRAIECRNDYAKFDHD